MNLALAPGALLLFLDSFRDASEAVRHSGDAFGVDASLANVRIPQIILT